MWRNMFRKSIVTAFILGGLIASAWGQRPGLGPVPFGGGFHGFTEFTGQVVCVGCSLEEAREIRPHLLNLYQFNHEQEQIVMQIDSFADSSDRHYWQVEGGNDGSP